MFRPRLDVNPVNVKPLEATIASSKGDSRERALLLNIGELARATQQLQISTISYINFAGLISVGALTAGLIKPERLVEIFAPYALTVVLTFLLQLYTDIERLITLREVLEVHLNSCLDKPAFLGRNDHSAKYRGRGSVRLAGGLLSLPVLFFAMHSLQTTATPHDCLRLGSHCFKHFDHFLNILGLSFCLVVLLKAGIEMLCATRRAELEAKSVLGEMPQPSDGADSDSSAVVG